MATPEELAALDDATRDFRSARLFDQPIDSAERDPAQRDSDRILYSRAFRRLGGVTQVLAVSETDLFHNRLTHSLKVAQIGHRLTQSLRRRTDASRLEKAGNLDPEVVYAAGLAHDLGHPPFGHIAEDELQAVLAGARDETDGRSPDPAAVNLDSFEGNAQSIRIVTKLAWRTAVAEDDGLNLTRATLAATLKYPWMMGDGPAGKQKKWGAYRSEQAAFGFAVASPDGAPRPAGWRSPEAALMDWSDDIAYAVHDVEDFFRAGLIPLERLGSTSDREAQRFMAAVASAVDGKDGLTSSGAETAFETLRSTFFRREAYDGSRTHQVALSSLASALITRFTEAVRVDSQGRIQINPAMHHEVAVLKHLTFYYMIETAGLATLQAGQREAVRALYRRLVEWADAAVTPGADLKIKERQLPVQLAELLRSIRNDADAVDAYDQDDAVLRRRAVVDFLVGLTEAQTLELAERYQPGARASAIARWLNT